MAQVFTQYDGFLAHVVRRVGGDVAEWSKALLIPKYVTYRQQHSTIDLAALPKQQTSGVVNVGGFAEFRIHK